MQQIGWISPISSCKITKFLAKMFKGTRKKHFLFCKIAYCLDYGTML